MPATPICLSTPCPPELVPRLLLGCVLCTRHTSVESHVQAEVFEMRNELAEALLRVEQLSDQEAVLKATIRALETELKTERYVNRGHSE